MRIVPETVYQLKVSLNGTRPPIWRRVLVRSDTNLDRLHLIIQAVMGWNNSHLHQFVMGDSRYAESDPDLDDDAASESGVAVGSLLMSEGRR